MSKRLQVVFDDREFADLRRVAEAEGLTVSEWVRQTLRRAGKQRSVGNIEQRLAAIRSAAQHSFPTADIDEMLRQVERGYQSS